MADVSILNGYNIKDTTARNGLANKIDNPSTKSNGQVLTYNGSAWEAKTPSSPTLYTATLASGSWTQSGDYYTQTVTVNGLKATYQISPVVDCSLSGTDADADNAILTAFGAVAIISTGANSLTATAIDAAPQVSVPIIINVWE